MIIRPRHWGIAIAASLAAHVSAAGLIEKVEPPSEAGAGAQIMLLEVGDAFASAAAAGETTDTLDPVAESDDTAEPVETQELAASETEVTEAEPAEIEVAEHADTTEQAVEVVEAAADIETPDTVAPEDVRETAHDTPDVSPAPSTPVVETARAATSEPAETADSVESEQVQLAHAAMAVPVTDIVEAVEPVPIPVARPADAPKPVVTAKAAPKKQAKKPATKKKATTRPAKKVVKKKAPSKKKAATKAASGKKTAKASGSSGKQRKSAQKGGGKKKKASGKDRRAVSNYPGKVAGKLRRSWRYPRSLKGKARRGQVLVSFTVSANGSARGVRIARSSGSSALDQAAVAAVRRAAPFPPIPAAAGRRSWAFTVPLAVR